jgi:hypothetical protein
LMKVRKEANEVQKPSSTITKAGRWNVEMNLSNWSIIYRDCVTRKIYLLRNRYLLYMRWWFLQYFVSALMKKSNLKFLLNPLKLLTNLKTPFSNHLQKP